MKLSGCTKQYESRRTFIGGSDARIIMGNDEAALVRLWREKRGETDPEDLSGNLIVQLGRATEELNRSWYQRNTGRQVRDVQRHVRHSAIYWMGATLDGTVEGTEAVFEAKFMLPWSFSEEGAAEKYMAQLQHNLWVTHLRSSVLSVITGGGKWVEIAIPLDPLYLSVLVSAEKKFWRCVQSGEVPRRVLAILRDGRALAALDFDVSCGSRTSATGWHDKARRRDGVSVLLTRKCLDVTVALAVDVCCSLARPHGLYGAHLR
jgi:predicted phage-related endonuclease